MNVKTKLKEQKAITLIALVVTIIVLLILAGISISMLSGDNGILTRATDAKTKSDEAQIKERIQLAYHSALTKDLTGESNELTEDTLSEELENEFKDKTFTITPSEDKKQWVIKVDDVEVSIKAGKEAIKSNLTEADITAINTWNTENPTDSIAELTTEEIEQLPNATAYSNNRRIKAVLTGGVPLTTEMTYVTGSVDTGVVVAIGKTETDTGNEFVWVPVPNVIWDGTTEITSGTYTPMGVLQDGSTVNYRGVTYEVQTYPSKIATYKDPRYGIEPEVVESDTGS